MNRALQRKAQIVEYLCRYTHKVAITAHRTLHIHKVNISFKYKDYADGNKQKIMMLNRAEFFRRFEEHILPKGFVKIRHAGYLPAKDKMERIKAVGRQLKLPAPMQRNTYIRCLRAAVANRQIHYTVPCLQAGKNEINKNIDLFTAAL